VQKGNNPPAGKEGRCYWNPFSKAEMATGHRCPNLTGSFRVNLESRDTPDQASLRVAVELDPHAGARIGKLDLERTDLENAALPLCTEQLFSQIDRGLLGLFRI